MTPFSHYALSFLATGGSGGGASLFGNPLVMMIAIIMMMYFLMIRPQQKQRKTLEAQIAAMKKGDKVITIGGLHSIVHHISDKTVTLKLSEGVFVPFSKSAIQTVTKVGSDKEDSDTAESESESAEDSK